MSAEVCDCPLPPFQPEFTMYLSEEVIQLLSSMGSHFGRVVAKDEAWCVVAWQGGGVVHEALTTVNHYKNNNDAPPTSLNFVIPRKRGALLESNLCMNYYTDIHPSQQPYTVLHR